LRIDKAAENNAVGYKLELVLGVEADSSSAPIKSVNTGLSGVERPVLRPAMITKRPNELAVTESNQRPPELDNPNFGSWLS
jgi:hypothetical protein